MKLCMIAYSEYFNDARIKSYENILLNAGYAVDLVMLRDPKNKDRRHCMNNNGNNIYFVMDKYGGESITQYLISYVLFFIKAMIITTRLYFKEKYKVIHVHNMPNFIVYVAIVPKLFGSKIILDIHDLMIPIYLTKFSGKRKRLVVGCLLKLEQRISALFADHVICADHLQRDSLSNEYNISINKISVFMNLPNENMFKIVKVSRASDNFNLIYHGTISKRLGIDLLIKSVYLLKNKLNLRLFLYGTGEYLNDIIKLRKEFGLEDDVYIHGSFVSAEELSDIICSMDVGIIGNRYSMATNSYMMPVKLMEYVYHDIPVIAPRLDIIRYYFSEDMLKYYDTENMEQMCECIIRLYNCPEERKMQIKNARKFFQKYSSHETATEYLNLVQSV